MYLILLKARYYDQGIGRFTQQDSYQGSSYDQVTLHKYLYENADPVRYSDLDGSIAESSPMSDLQGQLVLGGEKIVTKALSKLSKEKQIDLISLIAAFFNGV